jgi:hypothetical protein
MRVGLASSSPDRTLKLHPSNLVDADGLSPTPTAGSDHLSGMLGSHPHLSFRKRLIPPCETPSVLNQ